MEVIDSFPSKNKPNADIFEFISRCKQNISMLADASFLHWLENLSDFANLFANKNNEGIPNMIVQE